MHVAASASRGRDSDEVAALKRMDSGQALKSMVREGGGGQDNGDQRGKRHQPQNECSSHSKGGCFPNFFHLKASSCLIS